MSKKTIRFVGVTLLIMVMAFIFRYYIAVLFLYLTLKY